ncbi:MAG TPA: O-methyltransferase [Hanamia sp.]|nr:O-methyltransferase [Hanamia sp.]
MPEIISDKVNEYASRFSEPTDDLLKEIEEFTLKNHPHSNMLSGHWQGKLLEMLSKMVRPSMILEVGTFVGYSALCLAKGLKPGGELHTLELRDEDADTAEKYFARCSQADQIILHRGNALELIPSLNETWDLVFIDADKTNYINYYELVVPRVRQGGVILADNVLFHGEVLTENITGKNAIAINAFNEHVAADERTQQVIITVRDGLMLIIKK